MFQLVDKKVGLKLRAEFLRYQAGARLHAAAIHDWNLTDRTTSKHKGVFSLQKDGIEGVIRIEKDGHVPAVPDHVEAGVSYFDNGYADISAQIKVNPSDLNGKKDLHFGIAKRFAPNLYVKARANWFTGLSAYYAQYVASKNCTVAATLEISHCHEKNDDFKGCCGYPFNFGVKLNFNA